MFNISAGTPRRPDAVARPALWAQAARRWHPAASSVRSRIAEY